MKNPEEIKFAQKEDYEDNMLVLVSGNFEFTYYIENNILSILYIRESIESELARCQAIYEGSVEISLDEKDIDNLKRLLEDPRISHETT